MGRQRWINRNREIVINSDNKVVIGRLSSPGYIEFYHNH